MSEPQMEATTYLVVSLALPALLLILGVGLGFSRAKKDEGQKFNWTPFVVCWGLVALSLIGRMGGESASSGQKSTNPKLPEGQEFRRDVLVAVGRQPAPEGAVIQIPTGDVLINGKQEMEKLVAGSLRNANRPTENISSDFRLIKSGSGNVLLVVMKYVEGVAEVKLIGKVKNEILEITCVPPRARPFVISDSGCSDKARELFGEIELPRGEL